MLKIRRRDRNSSRLGDGLRSVLFVDFRRGRDGGCRIVVERSVCSRLVVLFLMGSVLFGGLVVGCFGFERY